MSVDKKQVALNKITIPKGKKAKRIHFAKMHEVILTYSGEEFENFIFEWLKFCKQQLNEKTLIYRIGGPGDKGIDIYYQNNNEVVYYQAKQYNKALSLNDVIDICVKIFYYVSKEEIPMPTKVRIVSSKGINSKQIQTFTNKAQLKAIVVSDFNASLNRMNIKHTDEELAKAIRLLEDIDFSMIENIDVDEIILDYYKSDLGTARFYKDQPFRFRKKIEWGGYDEDKFVLQIKSIYPNIKIQKTVVSDAKNDYYSCLCLKETDKYLFGNNCEFDAAIEEVFQGINMLFYNNKALEERYVECLKQATQLRISNSALGDNALDIINNADRKGMCHYLVNEEKIGWVDKDE